jgi:hypothetical protein
MCTCTCTRCMNFLLMKKEKNLSFSEHRVRHPLDRYETEYGLSPFFACVIESEVLAKG